MTASRLTLLALPLALASHACRDPEVFESPAALAASDASGLPAGYRATVCWQGAWDYEPGSDAAPDGETVVEARGGGRWLRDLAGGWPGALAVADWYVDSAAGDDSADCRSSDPGRACRDLSEVLRRFGAQRPGAWTAPTVHLRGDFSGRSYVLSQAPFLAPTVRGERRYAAPDGTPYPCGTVVAYVPWDGGAHQEGVATVMLADGTPLDVAAYGTEAGFLLEVRGGDRDGLGVVVSDPRGPGTFATSGGFLADAFELAEPAAGDEVCAYRLTELATAPGTSLSVEGGSVTFRDVEVGSAQHTVELEPLGGADNGVMFESCILRGGDLFEPGWLFFYGSVHLQSPVGDLRVYGRLVTAGSTFDGLQGRDGCDLELSDRTLVTRNGIWVGGRDGEGYAVVDGPAAVVSAAVPGLRLDDASLVHLAAPLWVRSAGQPAAVVRAGSTVLYDPGYPPACVGACPASPWVVGGASFAAVPASHADASVAEDD